MLSSVLVVAVEVITSTESGPYALPQFLDFGLGGTRDPPKKVFLKKNCFYNSYDTMCIILFYILGAIVHG